MIIRLLGQCRAKYEIMMTYHKQCNITDICEILFMGHDKCLEYCDAYRLNFTHREKVGNLRYYIQHCMLDYCYRGVEIIGDSRTYYKLTLDKT